MVNVIALVFAGLLVGGIALAIGCSNAGPSVNLVAREMNKLAPNYWNRAEARMQYNLIQAPTHVGPAWTAADLPTPKRPKPKRRPLFEAPSPPPPPPAEPDLDFLNDDEVFALPSDGGGDPFGSWEDSPSPLGRVA